MITPGNVMIITGASSGFGRLTALMAVEKGYRLVVAARRTERLDELVAEIERRGGTALAIPCDVTKEADQQRLIDRTLQQFGRIDVLVNNAGVPLQQSFVESSVADLRRQWETNVLSIVTLTKLALPALMDSRGVVINIGSVAGHFSVPGWGMYFPTKVSVRSASHMLRRELRPYGVRVSLVEPGPFSTEFGERAGTPFEGALPPEMVAAKILRMAERPQRVAIVPGLLAPAIVIGGGLAALVPDLVDWMFWAIGARKLREQDAGSTAVFSPPKQ